MSYELDKTSMGLSPHVKRHYGLFLFVASLCWLIWAVCQTLFSDWLNVDDPWATVRMLLEKIMTVVPGFTCGGLAVLFWDTVCNGNLIKGILRGKMACAVFASVIFFGTIFLYLRIIL